MSFIAASIVGFLSGILASMGLGGGFVLVVYFAIFTDFMQKGAQGIGGHGGKIVDQFFRAAGRFTHGAQDLCLLSLSTEFDFHGK